MTYNVAPREVPEDDRARTVFLARAFRLVLVVAVSLPGAAQGQTATVRTQENFRVEPNGTVLAQVRSGTVLTVEGEDGGWLRVTLEGWVWSPSLEATDRMGLDFRVAADGGENLRSRPQGSILARLSEGTLLGELETRNDWVRVRRTGWIWKPSVAVTASGEGARTAPPPRNPAEMADSWSSAGSREAALLSVPDGDTLARSLPGTELRVLGRRGNWARVRVEGWVWLPGSDPATGSDSTVLTDVTPEEVLSEPDRYGGRVVAWDLQFVSREEAESFRTDFYEGEPYLLTRIPERSSTFVYVTVPPERLSETDDLTPLERITVVGRIRTGEAALAGGPIVDLLELSRGGGGAPDAVP